MPRFAKSRSHTDVSRLLECDGERLLERQPCSLFCLRCLPAGKEGKNTSPPCFLSSQPACGPGRLEVEVEAEMTPPQLSNRKFVPVEVAVRGTIGTQGGGHPSALRKVTVALDDGVKIDTEGLVACPRKRLVRLDAAGARRACGKAIVGNGTAHVGFASSESVVRAPFTLFNGGTSGDMTRLVVQSVVDTPEPTTLVGVAKIVSRQGGLEANLRLPRSSKAMDRYWTSDSRSDGASYAMECGTATSRLAAGEE